MSAEYEKEANGTIKDYQDYHRKYQRETKRGIVQFRLKPSTVNKFKEYYNEYLTRQQQDQTPTVEFKEFIFQFAETGFLAWRSKIKGK